MIAFLKFDNKLAVYADNEERLLSAAHCYCICYSTRKPLHYCTKREEGGEGEGGEGEEGVERRGRERGREGG